MVYGFDRIQQICELHAAGYKFSVLNNAFLVHDVSIQTYNRIVAQNYNFRSQIPEAYRNLSK